MRLKRLALAADAAVRLGLGNALSVALYRARASRGWVANRSDPALAPIVFHCPDAPVVPPPDADLLIAEAEALHTGTLRMLGADAAFDPDAPNWHLNRLTGRHADPGQPWWKLSDADAALGDIKYVWEASRFDWSLLLARATGATGDARHIDLINGLLASWAAENPPYLGANWMCAQEVSIRLVQTLLAARLLGQDHAETAGLAAFVAAHLERIAPARVYGEAQNNNHATSEAAGLYIGGGWLAAHCDGALRIKAALWKEAGRAALEKMVARIVFDDGGFAQYSTNYHRVLLETLSQAEYWRRALGEPAFSGPFYAKARAATRWLAKFTNAHSGDAPNLGANDGARVYRLDSLPYRDHRGAVQTAAALFCEARAFAAGAWDAGCRQLGLAQPEATTPLTLKTSQIFPDFGLALLNPRADGGGSYAFLRFPVARFRPGQADPLHFDLWSEHGEALLRDGGSGSYASEQGHALSGIAGHNSVAFDARDPMPRLSRFLFAKWIRADFAPRVEIADGRLTWWAQYRDAFGAEHRREIDASGDQWRIVDRLGGRWSAARLRWRLWPGQWRERLSLSVACDGASVAPRIEEGIESPTYGRWSPAPVATVDIPVGIRTVESVVRLL